MPRSTSKTVAAAQFSDAPAITVPAPAKARALKAVPALAVEAPAAVPTALVAGHSAAEVRAYALAAGLAVGSRGKLPRAAYDAYTAGQAALAAAVPAKAVRKSAKTTA